MDYPFKIGDVVYHSEHGKGLVKDLDCSLVPIYVKYESGKYLWSTIGVLSFKPWPKPCHERPFEPVLKKGDKAVVYLKNRTYSFSQIRTVEREEEHIVRFQCGIYASKDNYEFYLLGDPVKFN